MTTIVLHQVGLSAFLRVLKQREVGYIRRAILDKLKEVPGRICSLDELAEEAYGSTDKMRRDEVSKVVGDMRSIGIRIVTVKGRGYYICK